MLKTIKYENQKLAEINPSFEEYVTEFCHGNPAVRLTPALRKFLEQAYHINVLEQKLWSCADFRHITGDSYRKNIQRLSPLIERVIPGRPCFYKLRGTLMHRSVTQESRWVSPKEVTPEFEAILASLKAQPPMMHDIRIEARIAGLYENLLDKHPEKLNPHNKSFSFEIPTGNRFSVTVNIYPTKKMQVIVGCTHNPLPYTVGGFSELSALLGEICSKLQLYCDGEEFYHSPIPEWKIQYLHLNRDGKEINGNKYSYSITDLVSHSVQYLKRFKDGSIRPRFEEHKVPNQTIAEVTESLS